MNSRTAERENFTAQLTRALPTMPPHVVAHYARLLVRHSVTHGRLAEMSCNGHPLQSVCPPAGCDMPAWNARVNKAQDRLDAYIEKREGQIERRITAICAELGLSPNFQGDPRGYTVKVALPNGAYNTWGGREDGWGVPQ